MKYGTARLFRRKTFSPAVLFLLILFSGAAGSCTGASSFPDSPAAPVPADEEASGPWREVLAADNNYPDNLYLTQVVEFHPGPAGESRALYTPDFYDARGYPLAETAAGACGPPEGSYPVTMSSSGALMAVMGSGGWAVWKFEAGRMVVNGPGDDFITFSNHNVLGSDPDGSWNELGRIFVSPDNVNWYENQAAAWDGNLSPGAPNSGYVWAHVSGLHGNTHTWANFRKEVFAQELDFETGLYADVTGGDENPVVISPYFTPSSPNLGGDRFDLADFVHTQTGVPWPEGAGVRYLKLKDDPAILDGQDYAPGWMTGSRLMSALGIYPADDPEVP